MKINRACLKQLPDEKSKCSIFHALKKKESNGLHNSKGWKRAKKSKATTRKEEYKQKLILFMRWETEKQ